jgi:hypothetical protein
MRAAGLVSPRLQPVCRLTCVRVCSQSLEKMLTALEGARNIITVFGCRGDEDPTHRPEMAAVAHEHSSIVIITNDSPRTEPPGAIVKDIVAGLPDHVVNRFSGFVYFPFQDQGHVPLWFEPYLQKAQRTTKRYIMEDRFSAIRAAIGTAGPDDVVLIAGRGHKDCMEYGDENVGTWCLNPVGCHNSRACHGTHGALMYTKLSLSLIPVMRTSKYIVLSLSPPPPCAPCMAYFVHPHVAAC